MKNNLKVLLLLALMPIINGFSQEKKPFVLQNNDSKDDIVMTWNKNTPEQEMKDDVKALGSHGITIHYSNVKRNSKGEIIAIKVEYADRKGNKGALELDNQKPINTIKFFKQGDEIGFGEPSSSNDMLAGSDLFNSFPNGEDFLKQFNFGNEKGDGQSFQFSFPNGDSLGKSDSKIIIKKDGKKPLVIENGVVTEGGEDYTPEEIEQIKKDNKMEGFDFNGDKLNNNQFDLRNSEGLEHFKKEMERMKKDMEKMTPDKNQSVTPKEDFNKTKEEMLKAKEEMNKAKEDLEKAKKDLENAKSALKTQKA